MSTPIMDWPAGLPQCFESWSEQAQPVVIRTDQDNGAVKVRRRFTAAVRHVQASMVLDLPDVRRLLSFFEADCKGGVLPFRINDPIKGAEGVFRMRSAPSIANLGPLAATASLELEQLPYWG